MSNRKVPESVSRLTEEFVEQIKELYKDRLDKVILFGSYARGEERDDSDVDYLVVLNDASIKTLTEISFMSELTSALGLKYGKWISAIPLIKDKLVSISNVFGENVRQEGIVL